MRWLAVLLCLALAAPWAQAATSVTFQPSTADSHIDQNAQTTNSGNVDPILVESRASKAKRIVVRFDVSTIPSEAAVKSAALSMRMTKAPGQSRTYGAHRITGTTLWTETGVTWNSRNGTTNWTTAGGDFNAATDTTTTGTTGNVTLSWDIPADVQAWVDGSATNNGILIKDETEGPKGKSEFASKENGTAANRPKLVVTYLLKVRDLTATAGNAQVTLNWVLPGGSPDYNGALVLRRAGSAPTSTPTDGTNHAVGSTLADGSVVVFNDTALATTVTDTGLTNGTTYYYQAFARDGSTQYSFASATVNSTPTSTAAPDPNWSYATSAASLAPPGLAPNDVVVMGSNDNKLHGMNASDGTRAFNPFATGGAIQARPPVIPTASSTSGVDIAYVTSQDGFAYAVNANTGAQVWKSAALGTQLQGGAAVWLQSAKALDVVVGADPDVVLVGTRNGASDNKVYALNGNTGATIWTFNPGTLDIIVSTPYVDYENNVIWVTSRSNGGTQASLWKLNATDGTLATSFSLGDIDSSPVASLDGTFPLFVGTFRYVGTNAGELKAIRVTDGVVFTHTPASGSGAVKGFPLSFSFSTPSAGTPDTIVFSRDTTVHKITFNGSSFSVAWTTTLTGTPTVSTPIDDGGSNLYVGASDGKVHQLRLSDGVDEAQRTIVPSSPIPTVGDPSFDGTLNRVYVGATDGHIYSFAAPF